MGIFVEDIYKRHFPVKNPYTDFTEQEKEKLCKWTENFERDVRIKRMEDMRWVPKRIHTINLNLYEPDRIIDMIKKNHFDEYGVAVINTIISCHKYRFNFIIPKI